MSYTPTTWQTGDVVTAVKLNNMESGISNNDSAIAILQGAVADAEADITAIEDSIAEEYSSSSTYEKDAHVMYEGQLYECISAITTAEAWTPAHWSAVSVDELLSTKAEIDGYYQDMTVGNAEQLVSSVYVEDSEPYNFRTSGGSADIGSREYDEIVGVSVGWNQALNPNRADVTGHGITFHNNEDGSFTVTGTADANAYFYFTGSPSVPIPTGNGVIYMRGCPEGGSANTYCITTNSGGWKNDVGAGVIFNKTSDMLNCAIKVGNGTSVNLTFWPQVFNLTQMFGSTIADYILGLETATAGAGVAWLKSHFQKMFGSYQPYDAGSIKSVTGLSAHVMTGFNQWDEEWEVGSYDTTTGAKKAAGTTIRNKNAIRILPDTPYFFRIPSASPRAFYYDESGAYLGTVLLTRNSIFTTPSNAYYLCFHATGTTYDNDICINISDTERNGEYEPYKEWSYPLDSTKTFRGVLKLDASNKPYAEGDFYSSDGTVDRRYGEKTYDGSEEWAASSVAQNVYYLALDTTTFPQLNDPSLQMVSNRYQYAGTGSNATFLDSYSEGVGAWVNTTIPTATQRYLYVKDSSISSVADFKAALAANPLTVVFTLQDEGTETANPYQSPQVVDDFGTEEYVSESIVPVGHNTKYQNNLVAKLEMAPDSPSGDGDYIVRQTDGQNEYVEYISPVPAAPSEDGTYTLKVTVSGSTVTKAWVAD